MTMPRLHLGGPSSRRRFELYICLLGVHFSAADGHVSIPHMCQPTTISLLLLLGRSLLSWICFGVCLFV